MNTTAYSRRRWIGSALASCGGLALGGLTLGQQAANPTPEGYTKPGPVTNLSLAPGLKAREVSVLPNGQKTYALIFAKGDEVMSGLTAFAVQQKVTAGYFTAIGALRRAKFGWFDLEHQAYRNIPVDEQVEVVSLIGDVGLANDKSQVHTHGAVGLPDGQVRGGHLLEAVVFPTLEVFFTTLPSTLVKKRDAETTLFLFDLAS
jgi:predicted DNA-binding protein with PD1-like motif